MMTLRSRLLGYLSDGHYHSGVVLGTRLGVSRMAVWKHIDALRDLGIPIESVHGKGYCLPGATELLDAAAIRAQVAADTQARLGAVETFLEIDSTSNWLRAQALDGAPSGTVCLAEIQHAGRGRRGRTWVSPFAANLYLSLLWRSSAGVAALGGLSLVAGIAVLRCLQAHGVHSAALKWPNDLLVNGSKLAGVLIDVVGESTGPCAVIIGIGLNVEMPDRAAADIDQPWVDLRTLTGAERLSRNHLAATLLDQLMPAIRLFEAEGMPAFMAEWRRHDAAHGREVELHLNNEVIFGTACGIDAGGALLVETAAGRRRFTTGEVSLRVTP
jgi:BirA family biotin operon repressor/biotin-[acetyl-CoA-carboxylase] ligase